jgi:hypothetical protein
MTDQDKNYNSSDEKQVAQAKRQQHNESQAEINDLRANMKTAHGRNTMWRLLSRCGVYQGGFQVDTNFLQFKEGQRNIGLHYLNLLTEYCFKEYQMMLSEQDNRKTK